MVVQLCPWYNLVFSFALISLPYISILQNRGKLQIALRSKTTEQTIDRVTSFRALDISVSGTSAIVYEKLTKTIILKRNNDIKGNE